MAQNSTGIKELSQKPVITCNMVKDPQSNLDFKTTIDGTNDASTLKWKSPSLMIVFDDGDINSAMHHLLGSLHNPFEEGSVATIVIQESVLDQFVGRVAEHFKELPSKVAKHPNYIRTLAKIKELKAKVVTAADKEKVPANVSPVLVYDFIQNYLGDGPTGVITLHTFRTPKEVVQIIGTETLSYSTVSVWNEKLACSFELVSLLKPEICLINCFKVDLQPIQEAFDSNRNDVCLVKSYHYESIVLNSKRRIIVFPVGTIFAN
ncbi:uncharacterized protein Dwil_GK17389 [Drosophila willistoni]|uniref:CG15717-PA n=1 Tax=Drosophila willistoni TaxID=7260 RepID=B4NQ79_DROWI|nr:uncharacterized protein LOC6653077 [Drosophila willistoni]EDW86304.2 uncharacterized protein Dwil_GK17389 [Drosophila willistoni]